MHARGFRLQEKKGRDGQKALARLLIKPASCMPTPSSCTTCSRGAARERMERHAGRQAGLSLSLSLSTHRSASASDRPADCADLSSDAALISVLVGVGSRCSEVKGLRAR